MSLSAAEQLLSVSDSPSTGSTHSPTHMTVPGDADECTTIKVVPRTDCPGPSAGTSDASPTSSSEVVTTESADTNLRTRVAGAAPPPWLRTATAYSKLPPGATDTLSGDTLATKSGEPVTVTLIAAEQLLSTSDSPSTGSTHSPTHITVPGDADESTVIEAGLLADSPGPSAGTSDASPTSSSDVVTTESADMNVRTLVPTAAAVPWLRTAAAYSKLPPGPTATLSGDTLATRSGELITVTTLIAAEQLLSTSDSPSTGSTHSPTHMTVPGDADERTAKVAAQLSDSSGSSADTSYASPTSSSDVVTTESADTNVRTRVAGAATSPRLRTATAYSKLPPGATATLSGDTLATRSGEPVTVTLIAAEQLFSTSDSPSTGSTHSPTHMTVPGDADELTAKVAAQLSDSSGPSAGTSYASPISSSDVVTTESSDTNVLAFVAGAAAPPRLRTATAYSKLPPGPTATLSGDTLATRSGEPVTVTAKLRLAVSPPGSRAVTVTMTVPGATG